MNPIENYISKFPSEIQKRLELIRATVKSSIPDVTEVMSYGVPAFKRNSKTVMYAAFKHHIGLYPTPDVIEVFRNELSNYEQSKGTIQFPHEKELPIDLILKITRYRLEQI